MYDDVAHQLNLYAKTLHPKQKEAGLKPTSRISGNSSRSRPFKEFVSRCRSAKRFANLNLKTRQNTAKNGALYDDIMNLLIEFVFLVLQGFYGQCKTSKCTMDEG